MEEIDLLNNEVEDLSRMLDKKIKEAENLQMVSKERTDEVIYFYVNLG